MKIGGRGGLDLVGSKEIRRYRQGTSELRAVQVRGLRQDWTMRRLLYGRVEHTVDNTGVQTCWEYKHEHPRI